MTGRVCNLFCPRATRPDAAPHRRSDHPHGRAIAALRAQQRTRIDELGLRRLERAAQPLVAGWTPTDLAVRIAAERVDQAENLPAVLDAILLRYALESSPRELGAARQAAEQARRPQPPPTSCAHGD